nr:hypothetical protein Iba_chr12eCG7090 [Ipomoea batatas]
MLSDRQETNKRGCVKLYAEPLIAHAVVFHYLGLARREIAAKLFICSVAIAGLKFCSRGLLRRFVEVRSNDASGGESKQRSRRRTFTRSQHSQMSSWNNPYRRPVDVERQGFQANNNRQALLYRVTDPLHVLTPYRVRSPLVSREGASDFAREGEGRGVDIRVENLHSERAPRKEHSPVQMKLASVIQEYTSVRSRTFLASSTQRGALFNLLDKELKVTGAQEVKEVSEKVLREGTQISAGSRAKELNFSFFSYRLTAYLPPSDFTSKELIGLRWHRSFEMDVM